MAQYLNLPPLGKDIPQTQIKRGEGGKKKDEEKPSLTLHNTNPFVHTPPLPLVQLSRGLPLNPKARRTQSVGGGGGGAHDTVPSRHALHHRDPL